MSSRRYTEQEICDGSGALQWKFEREGPLDFWLEKLNQHLEVEKAYQGLLVASSLKDSKLILEIIPKVKVLACSHNSRVRARAAYALGQIGNHTCIRLLQDLANDHSCRVRFQARCAIEELTGIDTRRHNPCKRAWKNGTILISDDDRKIQGFYRYIADMNHIDVAISSTMEESIELAKSHRPAMIITDNRKEGPGSGIEMTQILYQIPELQETVLVMVSGDAIKWDFYWEGGDLFRLRGFIDLEDLVNMMIDFVYR